MSVGEPKVYEQRALILCEGLDDLQFLTALREDRGLPACHIETSGPSRYSSGGNTKFCEKLRALRLNKSFRSNVDRICIITDSDNNEESSFHAICAQITAAQHEAPTAIGVATRASQRIVVYTIPRGGIGSLETILLEPLYNTAPTVRAHVDHFVKNVTTAVDWTQPRIDKLWLRCFVSARWPRDPTISLSTVFRDPVARRLIPLEHPSLDELVYFLRTFLEG